MNAIVYLKKRSNYTNKIVANCFIKTAAFADIIGVRGEVHVYKARLLSVDEFNADSVLIFSEQMVSKLGEVPKIKLIAASQKPVAKAPAPGVETAPPVKAKSAAMMAAAAAAATEELPAKKKPK